MYLAIREGGFARRTMPNGIARLGLRKHVAVTLSQKDRKHPLFADIEPWEEVL